MLCDRQTPFFFDQKGSFMRRNHFSSLMRGLATLASQKRNFFKFLRLTTQFVDCCPCYNKNIHTYCATAIILQRKRAYCLTCKHQYSLTMKTQKPVRQDVTGLIARYVLLLLVLAAFTFGFLCLDAWLKTLHLRRMRE